MSSPYLVINQVTENFKAIKDANTLNMDVTGLSKSRNYGLSNSKADICLIADDDLTFLPQIEEEITEIFDRYPDADIITFKVLNPDNSPRKNYPSSPYYHNFRTIMKVSSVEIALRRQIINDNLLFDERFGLGAEFPTGEEVIFLTDALKQGKKILYYPLDVVIHPLESSGSDYSVTNLAKAKGAMLYRMFYKKSYLLCFLFAAKHHKKSPYSYTGFLKEMFQGIKEFKN